MRPLTRDVLAALEPRELELGLAMGSSQMLRHWRHGRDADGVAWLLFDKMGASVNTIDEEVLNELADVLRRLLPESPTGIVIRSAKSAGFCAGADVSRFSGQVDPAEAERQLLQGHMVLDAISELAIPTVAVVHGHCLGGGLELALACRTRIAIDGASLGFPEVLLGLHPGLGGTVRSVNLIAPVEAMTMMLTGKTLDAGRAKAVGLVDLVTQERHVAAAVRAAVEGGLTPPRPTRRARIERMPILRRFLANRMRAQVRKRAREEHYPAPFALVDLWEKFADRPGAMRNEEIKSFAGLLAGRTAQNLIRVFSLREALRKMGESGKPLHHVHVIGAGSMGGDIAGWCALKGLRVTLSDQKPEAIGDAIRRAGALYRKRQMKGIDIRDALDRLIPDPRGHGVAQADLVIEAVPENLELKKSIYDSIEPRMKPSALLATNTSSISLDDLGADLRNPGRLVGLHFFNPVARMDLVEVVAHQEIFDVTFSRARAFVRQIGKLPAPVASEPGFLVNRALMPYMAEAMIMLEDGLGGPTIDAAAEKFGMPVGPVELADRVGLDICLAVADMLQEKLRTPATPGMDRLRDKVARNELGMKTGKGFYSWTGGKPRKGRAGDPPADTADRLILPMLNACVACLREGVVAEENTVDAAMIFGAGFAPFTGGPLHYARSQGVEDIVRKLMDLAGHHGPRFDPDEGWMNLAEE
ncbi:3-hydroxyacyl-CoA dehydrogenase NAD-binding domain-containing protein [Emcibacter sp. SYSU 3D8]|uniref:3-hydroxyacyl-CoA dehydrogenase NAD-binding domain-containing protein n=1 Tax=Emcibacter sp. SYSU 3D8 TaxID=3133969 RepID=UPI0031FF2F89